MKAVIFDLDGVITDTAEYHFLAWKRLADQLNIPFDRDFNERLKGISRSESLDMILVHGHVSAKYSEEAKQNLMDEKNRNYQQLIQTLTPDDLLPGIRQLLSELKHQQIKLALASASRNAPTILECLEIMGDFHTIVDPETLANGKPDPEIFLTAAKQLGVSPIDCIGIEDAEAGIASITSAGMFAVGVGNKQSMAAADLVVEETSDLSFALLDKGMKQWREKRNKIES
ncbi:beta-phosphoglucomutase [Bacillus sp. WMMC1349]|uniref:beta-phosphoglucomutase n=1 Tax=Bacillus sp. WMMC1349 TaxID=2736254 RepID=UPI001555E393|nr:beta-phosphoglucomutase [Bacillus sp. WMMC1349]NPC91727.1 beta-phosphoglucomutase [Bacillus sp. WMMC1349]